MLIKGGTILDGSGKKRYRGDVRVEKDKIKDIGDLGPKRGEKVINADNMFVAPGFVDIINRSDIHFSIFQQKGLRSFIKQGVTTILGGSCGASLAPIAGKEAVRSLQKWRDISTTNINWTTTAEFLDEVERHGVSVNFATLTGYSTLRRGLVGDYFGELGGGQIKEIAYLIERSIKEGSFGLSTGLAYSHERVAPLSELARALKAAAGAGGFYATHLRDEGGGLVSSVREAVDLARSARISAHIFHFKAFGRGSLERFHEALSLIEGAKKGGVDIDFDIYPYARTASVLYLLLPPWASEGGKRKVIERIRDEKTRAKIMEELRGQSAEIAQTVIGEGRINSSFIGHTIGAIAKKQDVPAVEAMLNLIIASEDRISGFIPIDRRGINSALLSKSSIVASDGAGYAKESFKHATLVHPRSFGAFPRFLARYVREKEVLSWEEAISKVTSLPAKKIGLEKRGKIEKGYFADIAVFNPEEIRDVATFKNPFQYSRGISHVIVNGSFALKEGKFQKTYSGRVLRSK